MIQAAPRQVGTPLRLPSTRRIRSDPSYGRGAPRDLVRDVNGHDRRTFFARLHIHLTNPGAPLPNEIFEQKLEFLDRERKAVAGRC